MPVTNRPIWDTPDAFRLPELTATADAEVCVVGLGGSGLTCVRELLERGRRVVGVDAVSIAAGAAGGNGGFLLGGLAMFHHDAVARLGAPAATAIYEQTLKQIDRIAVETPSAVRRTGTLRLAASPDELEDCRLQYEAMRHSALPSTGTTVPRAGDSSFPPTRRSTRARAARRSRPMRYRAARSFSGVLPSSRSATVGSLRRTGSCAPIRSSSPSTASSSSMLPELSSRVRSARLQMLGTAPIKTSSVPRPIYSRWGLDYWQQLRDGRIVLGGARDVGGEAEWTTETDTTPNVQAALETLLRDRVGSNAAITHRWAATVAYTQSGLPILEEVRPGVWAVGGYSGTGNVVGACAAVRSHS